MRADKFYRISAFHKLHSALKLQSIACMRRKYGDKLCLFCWAKMLKRVDHGERALALSDVRPKVFALYLGVSYQVEKIVLQLEGKAYLEAKVFERIKRLLVGTTNERTQYQGICC